MPPRAALTRSPDRHPPQRVEPHQASVAPPPLAQPPRLLERVRSLIKARHYSPRTEEAYAGWIRRFILFHGKRHPDQMGEPQIAAFLSHLATVGGVASTQNQALAA